MPEPRDEGKMPPIPDGGLSESMPEWLRRPPAWRTLKDADVVQTEPVAADQLPEPDTSVIDPRTFLTDDDLPLWLRNMGRGIRARPELPGDDDAADGEVVQAAAPQQLPDVAPGDDAAHAEATQAAPRSSRFVPRQPQVIARPDEVARRERSVRPVATPHQRATPWWQGAWMVALLAVLLLAAVAVIVILLVY